MDIVIMVTLSQCIIFGSHIPQGAPSSDSMSDDLRNKRRNNPAEEFGEEEQEKNTFILIGMETPVHIECIIANQPLCMVSGHACLFLRLQLTCWMGNNQICGQRQRVHRKGWCLGYIHKRGNFFCTKPNYMM
uniref:Uncharacterized protein n=1 Tax=Triticum urartu TaxID=4572 RepID=A0A8R7RDZ4_TRIUA